jgi:hypothetical protein
VASGAPITSSSERQVSDPITTRSRTPVPAMAARATSAKAGMVTSITAPASTN